MNLPKGMVHEGNAAPNTIERYKYIIGQASNLGQIYDGMEVLAVI